MKKLHDFLVEHAKFPFPQPDENRSVGATDISLFEVGLLESRWKAKHAVRDNTLVQKLCQALKDILGNTKISAAAERGLLESFSLRLQLDSFGRERRVWLTNPIEAQVNIYCKPNSRSSFGLMLAQESDIVRPGILPSHTRLFGTMWSISLRRC